jgi:hypothetical protein
MPVFLLKQSYSRAYTFTVTTTEPLSKPFNAGSTNNRSYPSAPKFRT